MPETIFDCAGCGQTRRYTRESSCGASGYASVGDDPRAPDALRHCFDCCARADVSYMRAVGRIDLYLTQTTTDGKPSLGRAIVSNWPGTLLFPVRYLKRGAHNIARTRLDVWFYGPDGYLWHGVNYGNFSEILRCRRTKRRWADSCGVRLAWPIVRDKHTTTVEKAAA